MSNWWDEEAERLNKMSEQAKKDKIVIPVGTDLPALNEDGSEKRQRDLTELLTGVKKKRQKIQKKRRSS